MSVQLGFTPSAVFKDGVYAGGAKASFFLSGTTTPIAVYTTEALTSAHPVPLVADSYGMFPQAFTDGEQQLKVVITTSVDTAITTLDPVFLVAVPPYQVSDVDTFADLATLKGVTVGHYVRVVSIGATYQVVASGGHLDYTGSGGVRLNVVTTEQVTPTMYGCINDGDFATFTGTDNAAAFTNMRDDAEARNVPVWVDGVYYVGDPDATRFTSIQISGGTFDHGIIVPVSATENAVQVLGPAKVSGFRIHCVTTESKPADSGHLQNCIHIGNGYLTAIDQPEVSGWDIRGLRLTRSSDGGGGGYAAGGTGNVLNGYIGELDDIGSGVDHSGMLQFHWGGLTATGTIGEEVTKSWHPRFIGIGELTFENCGDGLTLSSVASISQRGLLSGINANRILYLLPGDEVDSVSQHEAGLVGSNISIEGPLTGTDMNDESTADCVRIFSNGTSRWAFMPNDPAVSRSVLLNMNVRIGDINIVGSPNQNKHILDIAQFFGALKVGKISGRDCTNMTKPISISHSYGDVEIAGLYGDFKFDCIDIGRSSNVTVSSGDFRALEGDVSSEVAVALFGNTKANTVSGAVLEDATTLPLTTALSFRVMTTQPISVNGETVYATAYAPVGATTIEVTPLPTALVGGEAVILDHNCRNLDITCNAKGGYYCGDFAGVHGVLRGSLSEAAYGGARFRDGSFMTLHGVVFSRNGQIRETSPGTTTSDISVTNELNRITMLGGSLGVDGRLTTNSVICNTTEGTRVRFTAVGVAFIENTGGNIVASSAANYSLVDCTDTDGTLIP